MQEVKSDSLHNLKVKLYHPGTYMYIEQSNTTFGTFHLAPSEMLTFISVPKL